MNFSVCQYQHAIIYKVIIAEVLCLIQDNFGETPVTISAKIIDTK